MEDHYRQFDQHFAAPDSPMAIPTGAFFTATAVFEESKVAV
jgi:hypothetical protein